MKKWLLAGAVMAPFVIFGGCATTSGTGGITVQEVQGAAVAACSFLPTAASVANLLSAAPAVATAESIAAIICAAISPATQGAKLKATPGPITVTVAAPNGQPVTITGSFVAAVKGQRSR